MKLKVVGDTEPITASDTRRLLLMGFTCAVSLLAIVAVTLLFVSGGRVAHLDLWAVSALALLTVVGTHGEEVFGDETAINGSMLIVVSGAGIAYAGGPLWVAGVCGLVAGLHWHHLRDRAKRKLLLNTCFTTLSVLAAVEVARALSGQSQGLVGLAATGSAAVAAYWLTDNLLVALVLAIAYGRPVRAHIRELVRSETEVIPFAVLGFANGYAFVKVSPWVGVLGSIALLIVTEALIFRRGRNDSIRKFGRGLLWSTPIIAVAAPILIGGVGPMHNVLALLIVGTIALTGVALLDRFRAGFGLCALIACQVAAVVALPDDRPTTIALVVGLAACVGFSIRTRRAPNRFTILSAAIVAAVSLGGSVHAFELSASASTMAVLLAGASGGLVGLTAWHLTIGSTLALDRGRSLFSSSVSLMRGEVGIALLTSLGGAASGWIGLQWGVAGLAISLVAVLVVFRLIVGRTERRDIPGHSPPIDDVQLLGVLQSAVLDVPASRLPD